MTAEQWYTVRDRNQIRIVHRKPGEIGHYDLIATIPAARRGAHRGERVTYIFSARAEIDADLIAAAPDLLAACQGLLESGSLDDSCSGDCGRPKCASRRQLTAAIAKATGEAS